MQEATSFQSASYLQKFDAGKHRVVMVKDLDVHFDGKITVFDLKCTGCLSSSACSTSHALASLIFKEDWRCVTFLEVYPCTCIWWKAWFHLCHLLLTSAWSPCRNTKGRFKGLHAVLMVLCWTACPELLTHCIPMPHACRTPHPLAPGQVWVLPTTPLLVLSQTYKCLSLQLNCRRGGSFSRASSKKHCST